MARIIAISGKIGSGKDHVTGLIAGYIAREGKPIYKKIEVLRFADPIKTGIAGMFNHHSEFLLNDENKKQESPFNIDVVGTSTPTKRKISYGELQQHFGDAMRNIDEDIFSNILISRCNNSKSAVIIIPDLRYSNELKALQQAYNKHILCIKLVGTYIDKKDSRNLQHSSETSIDSLPDTAFKYILNRSVYKDDILRHHIRQILVQENFI